MSYYLQDNPNPNTAQFGWPRKKVSGVVGVHTAENNTDFEGADPGAEDVARFLGRRIDYGSYHAIADADSRIKLVHPSYAAWADTENNPHAMSVSGAMQAARWRELSPARAAAITRNMAYAAAELVQDAIAAGLMTSPTPARRITPAEAIAGSKAGFYGHGETNPGRRYDPGQNFDWNLFLTTYASAIGGLAGMGETITPQSEEDDMPSLDEIWDHPIADPNQPGKSYPAKEWLRMANIKADKAAAAANAVPAQVLYDQRVDGRNLFDWLKQLRSDVVGIQPGSVDVAGIAKALAEQLPKADAAALVDALAARLSK